MRSGWGVALGAGGLVAMFAGVWITRGGARLARLGGAFLAAFAAYEIALFGFACAVGGTDTFTLPIVARLFLNDALWFVALVALHRALAGVAPALFGRPAALRLA